MTSNMMTTRRAGIMHQVFRAAQLVVPDLRVTSDPLFASISVTAENWVPLEEVKEPALLAWLQKKKAEGWCLCGLEQTADSVSLPAFDFPQRCVLVLGREREGMPPEVSGVWWRGGVQRGAAAASLQLQWLSWAGQGLAGAWQVWALSAGGCVVTLPDHHLRCCSCWTTPWRFLSWA
jgi:hypothetical protein